MMSEIFNGSLPNIKPCVVFKQHSRVIIDLVFHSLLPDNSVRVCEWAPPLGKSDSNKDFR